MQDFEVKIPEGKDIMVLDVLALVKDRTPQWPIDVHVERGSVVRMG
jgi:hypothetical protein